MTIKGQSAPRCSCGQGMRYHKETDSWACPETLDSDDWGRPKKGHMHYLPGERVGGPAILGGTDGQAE